MDSRVDTRESHEYPSAAPAAEYDLLVIGAGIFGSMLALEASQRGLSVLLVEQQDFAGGTSANSLKTIHGGLRYLQSLDIKSCLQSANERKNWLSMAPGMVKPLACVLPTSRELMKSKLVVGAGAQFYNVLTMARNQGMGTGQTIPAASLISLEDLREAVPFIESSRLTGGARWYDAQAVNTERLVLACVFAAQNLGARVENYSSIEGFEKTNSGALFKLVKADDREILRARYVIDCSGKSSYLESTLASKSTVLPSTPPCYVKAVNLVIKRRLSESAVGVKALDASGMTRLLFLSPWTGAGEGCEYTLVGTWYFPASGSGEDSISEELLNTCVKQINTAFEQEICSVQDIVQVHMGFLPADEHALVSKGVDNAFVKHAELVDWGQHDSQWNGLFTLKGTKYTLARLAAEQSIDRLSGKYRLSLPPSRSAKTPLWSGTGQSWGELGALGLSDAQLRFLSTHFQGVVEPLTELLKTSPQLRESVPGAEYCCQGVLRYCLEEEKVVHLSDLLIRRVPIGAAEVPESETLEFALDMMREKFHWSDSQCQEELVALHAYYLKQNNWKLLKQSGTST